MRRTRRGLIRFPFLAAAIVVFGSLSPSPPLDAQTVEYPATGDPFAITPGSDGNLWFTDIFNGTGRAFITTGGVITPRSVAFNTVGTDDGIAQGQLSVWATVPLDSAVTGGIFSDPSELTIVGPSPPRPLGITQGRDATQIFGLYIADTANPVIWRFDEVQTFTGLPIPKPARYIANDLRGNVWFTQPPDTVCSMPLPAGNPSCILIGPNAAPERIIRGLDGGMWFIEAGPGRLGRIDLNTRQFTDFAIPGLRNGLAAGPRLSDIWVTSDLALLRISAVDGSIISTHPTTSQPEDATLGPDGNIWFTEGSTSNPTLGSPFIGKIVPVCALPAAVATAFPASICPGFASALTGSGGTSCSWSPATGLSDPTSCTPTATPSFTTTYTVTVANSCGTARASTVVTVTPHSVGPPITAPSTVLSGQTDLTASIPNPLSDATYTWTIQNGTITSSAVGPSITFTAGSIGTLSLTVSETRGNCVSDPSSVAIQVLPACSKPSPPPSAEIRPTGNPDGPVTGIDHLDLSWTPPTPLPAFYVFAVNGGPTQTTTDTSATDQPPTGNNDPITLSVRAACAEADLSAATEVTVSPTPPGADFSIPASVGVGAIVTFTDTSAPAATSWLWIFGDGGVARTQSAGHIYETGGVYTVWLIASNGAGASAASRQLTVGPAGAVVASARVSSRGFDETGDPARRRLLGVRVAAPGRTWLHIASLEQAGEAVVFLRFLGRHGALVAERRLSVGPGQEAIYDLAAYGIRGVYTLELFSQRRISPFLVEPARTRIVPVRGGGR